VGKWLTENHAIQNEVNFQIYFAIPLSGYKAISIVTHGMFAVASGSEQQYKYRF